MFFNLFRQLLISFSSSSSSSIPFAKQQTVDDSLVFEHSRTLFAYILSHASAAINDNSTQPGPHRCPVLTTSTYQCGLTFACLEDPVFLCPPSSVSTDHVSTPEETQKRVYYSRAAVLDYMGPDGKEFMKMSDDQKKNSKF